MPDASWWACSSSQMGQLFCRYHIQSILFQRKIYTYPGVAPPGQDTLPGPPPPLR
ncbi:hypothetical protein PUN28_016275 [Cardiocondyla obscurior]|uniref:Uncharacterized protein n=1 Tax=Cardiocondyla obscurior TaxID=286306 RepID=A0AAW2ETH0_9HYME